MFSLYDNKAFDVTAYKEEPVTAKLWDECYLAKVVTQFMEQVHCLFVAIKVVESSRSL